jgi:hypothetical protein
MPLPKTVKKNRTSWRPSWPSSARPQLHDLSADDVRQSLAAGYSTAAVSMSTSRSSAPSGTPKPTTWWPATSPPWPTARPASGSEPGMNGRTPAGLHYLPRRRPRRRGTSGRCSNGSVPKPETNGHPRAADLLRQPDEPPRRQYRGDRPPRRTRLYLHHRDRLPPRAPVTRSIPRPR